jgi:hypothetical protein
MNSGDFFPVTSLIGISAYIVALFIGASEMPRQRKRVALIFIALGIIAFPVLMFYSIVTSDRCQFGACADLGVAVLFLPPLLLVLAAHLFSIAMRKE